MSESQSGFSLVGAMITSVILIGVAIGLVAIVQAMYRQSGRAEAEAAADQAISLINGILSNKDFSNSALRTVANAEIHYDPANPKIVVDQINLWNPEGAAAPYSVLKTGVQLTPKLSISAISLTQTVPPSPTSFTYSGQTYSVYPANIVLEFSGSHDFTGGAIKPRTLAVTLLVGGGGDIDYCFANLSGPQLCLQMGGMIDKNTGQCSQTLYAKAQAMPSCSASNVTTDCPTPPAGEGKLYAVTAFSADGTPQCTCQLVPITYLNLVPTPWPVPTLVPTPVPWPAGVPHPAPGPK